MLDFGYLIVVSKNDKIDYHAMAYILAMSIKITQKKGYDNVALVTDDFENLKKYKALWPFDHVIEWDGKKHWDGRSYMYDLSPWRYTVCLDSDMIFFRDCSHWIDFFISNEHGLYISNVVNTFSGEIVTDDYYRKSYKENNLPTLYSAYTWFDKRQSKTKDFFNLVKYITEYPDQFRNYCFNEYKPFEMGTDEIFSLASDILNLTNEIAFPLSFPRFVHMKPMIQNNGLYFENWPIEIGFYIDEDLNCKVGNITQADILHYVEKEIDIDLIIQRYSNYFLKQIKND